ncbi:hypothetical protein Pan216_01210 [Planctomycetes bacterium Pan216]|uniref:Right handed beta helix domain-containing protein n=1 Tax=Kolteria novifilia TaxID=2527975 RepID=A0A518AX36_9BACT|nr:hypothetical protein Pan216_01210 [Planctomycetes bacterium Pan216]
MRTQAAIVGITLALAAGPVELGYAQEPMPPQEFLVGQEVPLDPDQMPPRGLSITQSTAATAPATPPGGTAPTNPPTTPGQPPEPPASDVGSGMPPGAMPGTEGDVVYEDEFVVPPSPPPVGGYTPRIGARYQTEGYGYENGYSAIQGFLPLLETPGEGLTFLDANILINNHSQRALNVGLAHRQFFESANRTLGGYVFYDNRDDERNYNQVGLGIETLGRALDARLNGYIVLGDAFVSNSYYDPRYFESVILLTESFQEALSGVDFEVGGPVPVPLVRDFNRVFVGGYYFRANEVSEDAIGFKARLESRFTDHVITNLEFQTDQLFGQDLVFGVQVFWPGFRPRNLTPRSDGRDPMIAPIAVRDRLGEPIVRNQNIVLVNDTRTVVATNSSTGDPITVIHVSSSGSDTGTGTVDDPVKTLPEAQAISTTDNIIFAHADSVFSGQGITLQSGQFFYGEGITHTFTSTQGTFTLPTATSGTELPIILNSPGSAVTLGDSNEVSGFTIRFPTIAGVLGDNASDPNINYVSISDAGGAGILLQNVTGTTSISDNTILRAGSDGIQITYAPDSTTSVTANIEDNTIDDSTNNGISLIAAQNTTLTTTISGNTVDDSGLANLFLSVQDSSTATATISDNTFTDALGNDGISMDVTSSSASLTATIENNTITGNMLDGINATASSGATMTLTISNNTAIESNRGNAISITAGSSSSNVSAVVTSNTLVSFNSGSGVYLDANGGTLSSRISSNTFSSNTGSGVEGIAENEGMLTVGLISNTFSTNASAVSVTNDGDTSDTTTTVCLTMTSNTSSDSNSGTDYIFTNNTETASQFQIEELDDLSSNNTGTFEFDPTEDDFESVSSGTCVLPTSN